MNEENVIQKAWWLSIAGVVPFLWLSLERWADIHLLQDVMQQPPLLLLGYYAAIILSFLGGITWGFALHLYGNSHVAGWLLMYSVIPALTGWVALSVMPTPLAWILLIGGFVAQLSIERSLYRLRMIPPWFWRLRCVISMIVIVTLLLNAITS